MHGRALVVLDVRGVGQLWGSSREVAQRLRSVAAEKHLGVRVAVARTKMAALLATQGRCGLTVISPGGEAKALSSLPLTVLKQLSHAQASGPGIPVRARRASHTTKVVSQAAPSSLAVSVLMLVPVVQRWGLKTLGELAALPADELFSCLGHGGLELQQIARGEDSQPFVPKPDEKRFEQTVTLEWPVEGLEPLSFVLARVLEPLCVDLEQGGVAVGRLHVQLTLVTRETHQRTLEFPASVSDPKLLRMLILLDLESHPPSAGIDRVTVVADPVPSRTLQFSLLERAVPSAECLSTLLARLTVLMGDRRCGAPVLVDTHHPGAFEMSPFTPPTQRSISSPQAPVATGVRPFFGASETRCLHVSPSNTVIRCGCRLPNDGQADRLFHGLDHGAVQGSGGCRHAHHGIATSGMLSSVMAVSIGSFATEFPDVGLSRAWWIECISSFMPPL